VVDRFGEASRLRFAGGHAGRAVIAQIDAAIAKGEPVVVVEPEDSESVARPSARNWYKTEPAASR